MKVAIVHYWLISWRGGEKVLSELMHLYPNADLYCHVIDPDIARDKFPGRIIRGSWINRLPFAARLYKAYAALMPFASEQLDLRGYDLVISSESGPAKNLITDPYSTHICYCHSPMRYIWDMTHTYLAGKKVLVQFALAPLLHYLRAIDQLSANRVDLFIANSSFVQKRIEKCYRRTSQVLNPPVELDEFTPVESTSDYYLVLGQLTSYKRVDLAVEAFNRSGKPLLIIGEGEEYDRLQQLASDNVQFMGRIDFESMKTHLQAAKALVFPGIEDFGIVPLEALASGTPVIAYAQGGAMDYLVDDKTGVLFHEDTPQALNEAIERFERSRDRFEPAVLAALAQRFSVESFRSEWLALVAAHRGETRKELSELPQKLAG